MIPAAGWATHRLADVFVPPASSMQLTRLGKGYLPSARRATAPANPSSACRRPERTRACDSSMSSQVTIWPVWPAMRPIAVTRLASAPRLTSL